MRKQMSPFAIAKINEAIARASNDDAKDRREARERRRLLEAEMTDIGMIARFLAQKDSAFEIRDENDPLEKRMAIDRFEQWKRNDLAARAYTTGELAPPKIASAGMQYAVFGGREIPTKRLYANIDDLTAALHIAMGYARMYPGYSFGVCEQRIYMHDDDYEWVWRWDGQARRAKEYC